MRGWWVGLFLLGVSPAPALAQALPAPSGQVVPPSIPNLLNQPNDFAHPSQPWDYYNPVREQRPQPGDVPAWDHRQGAGGQVIRYVEVPSRQVVIPVPRAVADSVPLQWRDQVFTVPAYWVAETTTGYYYYPRWILEESNVGVYQWRLLPAQFVRK
jgi:hypothetical protein